MSYAGVEHGDRHEHHHCGDNRPHDEHEINTGGHSYYVCTGQLKPPLCEHDRDARYDGLS